MSKWLKRAKKANPLLEDLSNILFRKRSKDKEALKDFSGWPWANDEKEVQYDHKKLNEWNASPLEEFQRDAPLAAGCQRAWSPGG